MPSAPTIYFILGMLFIALGVPLMRRRVPRNRWYGFRIPKTLASDSVWYPANAIAGRDMVVAGSAVAACALATMFLMGVFAPEVLAVVNLIVFVSAMIWSTVHSFGAIKKLP
jgi:uncharacterized membrane protein